MNALKPFEALAFTAVWSLLDEERQDLFIFLEGPFLLRLVTRHVWPVCPILSTSGFGFSPACGKSDVASSILRRPRPPRRGVKHACFHVCSEKTNPGYFDQHPRFLCQSTLLACAISHEVSRMKCVARTMEGRAKKKESRLHVIKVRVCRP